MIVGADTHTEQGESVRKRETICILDFVSTAHNSGHIPRFVAAVRPTYMIFNAF